MDFETLATHAEFVRGLARRLITDDDRAEDVAQQALIAAWANPPRNTITIRSWFRTVVRNFARKAVREDGRRERVEERAPDAGPRPLSPEEFIEKEILIRSVVNEVFQLGEVYRTIVILRFYENLTSREIADRIGSTPGVVRSQLKRALTELREKLDQRQEKSNDSWRVALLPFIAVPAATRSGVSPALIKAGAAALVLLGGTVAFLLWFVGQTREGAETVNPPVREVANAVSRGDLDVSSSFDRSSDGVSLGEAVNLEVPEPLEAAPIEMPTRGSLRATVRWAEDNEPAAGVRGRVTRVPRKTYLTLPVLQRHKMNLISDEHGIIHVDDLEPGLWYVYLDRTSSHGLFEVTAGEIVKGPVSIPIGSNIQVLAVDDEGQAIEGAEILIASRHRGQDFGSVAGKTGPDGTYRIRNLSLISFIGARAPEHSPARMPYVRADHSVQELSIRLVLPRGGGCMSGTVRDAVGDPIHGARVTLETLIEPKTGRLESGHGGSVSVPRLETTDERGRFEAAGIWTGKIEVLVEANGHPPFLGRVHLRKGRVQELDVLLDDGVTLTGQVVEPDGKASPSATVTVADSANCDYRLPLTVESQKDGRFTVDNLPAGDFSVQVFSTSGGAVSKDFDASSGDEIEWQAVLSAGRQILGRLVDDDKNPLSGWKVTARAPYGAWKNLDGEARSRAMQTSCVTDSEGRFAISNRMEGEHRLDVFSLDQWSLTPCFEILDVLPDGKEREYGVRSTDFPSASISATLVYSKDRPLYPASVYVTPKGRQRFSGSRPVNPDGKVSIGPLPPGEYRLTLKPIYGSSFPLGPYRLGVGETLDLGVIDLGRCGSFRANVRLENNEPFERPSLRLLDELTHSIHTSLAFDGGAATNQFLWPGLYRFCATGYGQTIVGSQAAVVKIDPGKETTLSVALQPAAKRFLLFDEPKGSPGWTTVMDAEVLDSRGELLWTRKFGRDGRGRLTTSVYLSPGSYQVRGSTDAGLEVLKPIEVVGFKEDVFRFGLKSPR